MSHKIHQKFICLLTTLNLFSNEFCVLSDKYPKKNVNQAELSDREITDTLCVVNLKLNFDFFHLQVTVNKI